MNLRYLCILENDGKLLADRFLEMFAFRELIIQEIEIKLEENMEKIPRYLEHIGSLSWLMFWN